ncbi:phospholipase A2, membrane associated-like [Pleurodeles waltl]|uniref:phospholipase A2, membrane associated-like n=1 Tax=Pleurodeles waltl TaxID=8319 RepID=UPI0037094D19
MKAAFLLAVFSSCLCLVAHGNLVNFADMIKKVTGKNAIPDYTTYGCYCGLGGRGQPVDATDRCCRSHDCCYIKLEARGCKPKTDSYRFSMSGGNVACGGSSNNCGRKACECDKTAALCFKANRKSYNWKYTFKPNFTCKGGRPAC